MSVHIVVMGICGSGKSSVARLAAHSLGATFIEADDFHPEANIRKMAAGHPLDDADRLPWLRQLAHELLTIETQGGTAVLACSALKRTYRALLASEARLPVEFAELAGPPSVIAERMARRRHFMPTSLVASQLDAWERLEPDELGRTYDIRLSVADIVDDLMSGLEARDRVAG